MICANCAPMLMPRVDENTNWRVYYDRHLRDNASHHDDIDDVLDAKDRNRVMRITYVSYDVVTILLFVAYC